MIFFFRTATATLLALTGLTACSAGSGVAQGTSVPVPPSGSVTTVEPSGPVPPIAPSPSGPYNRVPTGAPPSKPKGIPKTPTDILHSPGWVEGTITRGGSGPCYGLVTFDGVAYAVYSGAGTELAEGDHIRAELSPATRRIDCGKGIPVALGGLQRFP